MNLSSSSSEEESEWQIDDVSSSSDSDVDMAGSKVKYEVFGEAAKMELFCDLHTYVKDFCLVPLQQSISQCLLEVKDRDPSLYARLSTVSYSKPDLQPQSLLKPFS